MVWTGSRYISLLCSITKVYSMTEQFKSGHILTVLKPPFYVACVEKLKMSAQK